MQLFLQTLYPTKYNGKYLIITKVTLNNFKFLDEGFL